MKVALFQMNELAGSSKFGDLTLITSPLYKPSKIKSELVHRTLMSHLLYSFLCAISVFWSCPNNVNDDITPKCTLSALYELFNTYFLSLG